jgi:TonB family protein
MLRCQRRGDTLVRTILIRFVSSLSGVLILLGAATVAATQASDTSQKAGPVPLKVCSKENAPPCANAPKPLFTPDPEYSDKARKKKCRGTVLLETVVGTDGVPRDIRVTQPQGCGLNEQAIQALQKWRFEPGTRDGKPVPVSLMIEMDFRLY